MLSIVSDMVSEKMKGQMKILRKVWPVTVAVATIALLSASGVQAVGDIPDYATKVAGHHLKRGVAWSVWVFGARGGEGCWGTRATQGGNKTEGIACGLEVPESPWQVATNGVIGEKGARESVLVLLTRPRIDRLYITIKRTGAQPKHRLMAQVDVIDGRQARKARLPHAIGYASIHVKGVVCLSGVRAIESGRVVARGKLSEC